MNSFKPFSLTPGGPFSLWLDPARWPVSPLRLPGKAFTLWQDPAVWPVSRLRLGARGFTLWLDPAGWPVIPIRLPAKGFTQWLSPDKWPVPPVSASAPVSGPLLSPLAPIETLPTPEPVAVFVPEVKPLIVSQNKAFTLWTRPAQTVAIPMQNGLTAAQTAALAGVPSVSRGGQAEAKVLPPAAALAPAAPAPAPHPVAPPSLAERWLPLAAAVVAVFGLNSLVKVANSKKSQVSETEVVQLRSQLGDASQGLNGMKAKLAADAQTFADRSKEMEAKVKTLEASNASLAKGLAEAAETSRQSAVQVTEQQSKIQALSEELAKVKTASAAASAEAEKQIVKISGEASLAKRESGAALVGLREALAKAEEEKAAAFKAAAETAAALSALQSKLESAAKPSP